MISKVKKSGGWKIHLTMKINVIPSKVNDDKQLMHSKSDNKEIVISNKTNEISSKIFESLLHPDQPALFFINLESVKP